MTLVDRYARQVVLAEVGLEGQRRLGRATRAPRATGAAGRIEALYLERAGLGRVLPPREPTAPCDLEAAWTLGAAQALRATLEILELPCAPLRGLVPTHPFVQGDHVPTDGSHDR